LPARILRRWCSCYGSARTTASSAKSWRAEAVAVNTNSPNIVGSTLIRNTLAKGRVDEAAKMLQRLYAISGKVVHGSARGKLLHFPTANVDVDNKNKLIPGDGVYAVDVIYKEKTYKGMLNIGCRPTFKNGKQHVIEVHIIDFNQNIYDETITIAFKKRLRDEKKFDSKEALIEQLEKDRAESLQI